jgi:hypothetical protein
MSDFSYSSFECYDLSRPNKYKFVNSDEAKDMLGREKSAKRILMEKRAKKKMLNLPPKVEIKKDDIVKVNWGSIPASELPKFGFAKALDYDLYKVHAESDRDRNVVTIMSISQGRRRGFHVAMAKKYLAIVNDLEIAKYKQQQEWFKTSGRIPNEPHPYTKIFK